MSIEELVQKYKEDAPLCSYDFDQSDAETMLSAALTELAAGYEQKQALLLDAHCERVNLLQERIRQLEVEPGDALTEQAVQVVGEVVAWRCKDYADGWIIFHGKQAAEKYQEQTDCLMQGLVVQPTHSISAAELERLRKDAWQGMETAPTDGTDVDLYGYIAYDVTDMRLTNCAFTEGEWRYFVCGEMKPITDISFTPEYWRPIIAPSIDAAIAAEGEGV